MKDTTGEVHFSTQDLADQWRVSRDKVRRMFTGREGVIAIRRPGGKRATIRIPESVARQVYKEYQRGRW